MTEPITFEKGECSRNRNANMAESDTSEIQEETPPAQPQQPPNNPAAATIEERINPELLRAIVNGNLEGFKKILGIDAAPKLLRAIVNGDLKGFKKIFGVGEPKDIESIPERNGGNSGLRGVICGGNTVLHVVAGVMQQSSSREISFLDELLTTPTLFALEETSLAINCLLQTILFVFPIKGTWKRIAARFVHVALPRWVFRLVNVSVLRKERMNKQIAEIICNRVPTLLNACNNAKETPLHCAAKAGRLEIVSFLVYFAREKVSGKLKKMLRAKNEAGETEQVPGELEKMLRAKNEAGETALHEAARSGYSGIVKELLSADEKLASLVDNSGISPLYWAVIARCIDIVETLISPKHLKSDADPKRFAGPDGQTVLHAAVMTQEEEILRKILNCERHLARPLERPLAEETDKAGNTPLHYAALIGNIYAVRELLLKDTGPVYKDNLSGSFPVHLAAEAGNFSVIKELLSKCPDVGLLLDRKKRNFLHVAVQEKRIGVIMWACQKGIGANMINAKDEDGNTPLHLAVISSESEICILLCKNKRMNPNIRNEVGLTPMDISEFLQDHQFTYSLNPQSIIHHALVTRGAFQKPHQPDISQKVDDFLKARADYPNQREGREMWNGVEVDIEKESAKYENMSKSLITGAVLISSATFASIFTVSGIYRGDNTPHALRRRNFFKAFIVVNIAAFSCAIVSTIWLLYSALSNIHLKYRKFYFQRCTSLLYIAVNLFILTFGIGGYIAIEALSEWLALLILAISGIVIFWNVIWNPSFVPLILLAPYMLNEHDQ